MNTNDKQLSKSASNHMIEGLGEYSGIDPIIVRVLAVLCIATITAMNTERGETIHTEKLLRVINSLLSFDRMQFMTLDRVQFDQIVANIRAMLNATRMEEARETGHTPTREQAIAETMRLTSGQEPSQILLVQSADLEERLNQRELEILLLIDQGLFNHEIAEHLVLAVSTVKWYINNIFRKLHAHSRTQAVARARVLGLL